MVKNDVFFAPYNFLRRRSGERSAHVFSLVTGHVGTVLKVVSGKIVTVGLNGLCMSLPTETILF